MATWRLVSSSLRSAGRAPKPTVPEQPSSSSDCKEPDERPSADRLWTCTGIYTWHVRLGACAVRQENPPQQRMQQRKCEAVRWWGNSQGVHGFTLEIQTWMQRRQQQLQRRLGRPSERLRLRFLRKL